jgi:putative flippase GtrA
VAGMNNFHRTELVVRYGTFALLSIVVNLMVQFVTACLMDTWMNISGTINLYGSMLAGTLAGLLLKYFLDSRYIFFCISDSLNCEVSRFTLYSLMGVLTTLIFWGTESVFAFFWTVSWSRYVGGFIGLTAGYIIKYHLDKRWVFAVDEDSL